MSAVVCSSEFFCHRAMLCAVLNAISLHRLRIMAAHALGLLRDDRVPGILKEGLGDRDHRVRGEIASSLGMYNPAIVSEMLIDIIKGDRSRYVRSAALYSLKRLYFRKSLLPLFHIYAEEKDPIFADMLRKVIVDFIGRFVSYEDIPDWDIRSHYF